MATSIYDPTLDTVGLTERELDGLMRRIGILTGGLAGWKNVQIIPGPGWAAVLGAHKALVYDLGLATKLAATADGDDAITGVIAHEIGHLRETQPWDTFFDDKPEEARLAAKNLLNLVEDKRIEVILGREFPGLEPKIGRMRRALTSPAVRRLMAVALPHDQFLSAIYGKLFDGDQVIPAHPQALEAWRQVEPLFESLVARWNSMPLDADDRAYQSTRQLWKVLDKAVWPKLESLRNLHDDEALERDPDQAPAPMPMPDDDDEGDATEAEQAGDDDGDDEDGEDQQAQATPGAPAADDDEDGDDDDATGDEEPLSGQGVGEDEGEAGEAPSTMPSSDDLQTLSEDLREWLAQQLEDALDRGALEPGEEAAANELLDEIDEAAKQIQQRASDVEALLDSMDTTPDDRRINMPDDAAAYNRMMSDDAHSRAAVMGQRFASILRENRYDRWGVIGHRSGPRIHSRKLASTATGRTDVFRKRERTRNRRYAIALLTDLSGSMYFTSPKRIVPAMQATIMAAEALELVQGIEFAAYGFSDKVAAFKPFDRPLSLRREKIGGMASRGLLGEYTRMALGLARAGHDLQVRYGTDDDTRKLVIMVTDGEPTDGEGSVRKVVAQLRREGVETIGLRIGTDVTGEGKMEQMFDSWSQIDDPADLPAALAHALRMKITKYAR